jgi:hypothetical protein
LAKLSPMRDILVGKRWAKICDQLAEWDLVKQQKSLSS